MAENVQFKGLISTLLRDPHAVAWMRGSDEYRNISGKVFFYQIKCGVLVVAEIAGLPESKEHCGNGIFAFHIHSGPSCTGNEADPFADALTHYDPGSCPHPYHAGDLPPLFENRGYAFQAFVTNRFSVREIIGRTVIIHSGSDDFTSQPSGNAGRKIACGQIKAYGS